jgi:hypothetical protein
MTGHSRSEGVIFFKKPVSLQQKPVKRMRKLFLILFMLAAIPVSVGGNGLQTNYRYTAAAGGAATGATNNVVAQTGVNLSGFNNIDWGYAGLSDAIGGAAGLAGGAAGTWAANTNWLVNGINSPVLRSAVVSPLAAGAGHVAGGTTANLFAGQSLDKAFANSFKRIGQSMAIGGAIGIGTKVGISYASGRSPWTGEVLAAKRGVQYSGDLVKAAQKLYPNKTGKIELHHITPKYLGGAKNGPLVPLDASYHQLITNEFRVLWPYGKGVPSATELQNIMKQVYSRYPLPPSY